MMGEAFGVVPEARPSSLIHFSCLLMAGATILLVPVVAELMRPLTFDDAFMFWRYALHVREGLGLAWNPDGIATYGLTSQLWLLVVLPFTATSLSADVALKLASLVTGLAGLAAIVWAAFIGGGKRAAAAGGVLAVLLLAIGPFARNLTTGMDTMLSFLANAVSIAALLAWRRGGTREAALVGLATFAAILARPENIIVAFGVPGLAWLLAPRRRIDEALLAFGLPALLLGLELALCQWVYGTALPLSFYAKSSIGYEGFVNRETPVRYMAQALPAALPAFALLLAFGRSQGRLLLVMTLPVAATFLYLATVRQVMGFDGRYYLPFLPFVLVPAAMAAADRLDRPSNLILPTLLLSLMMLVFQLAQPLVTRAEDAWLRLTLPLPVAAPRLDFDAATLLPRLGTGEAWSFFAQRVAARLPAGTSMAASEVGQVGAAAPDNAIIDLAGLNDREIGLHGFSAPRLVERAPDLIWLPHDDYTGARAALLADPNFRRHYRLIVGAFDFGLAIRLDSTRRERIEQIVAQAWRETYPGHDMQAYVARWPEPGASRPSPRGLTETAAR